MDLSFERVENILIVKLDGEFDLHTADYFKEKVDKKLNLKIKDLILDLEGIKFIDSSGLGAILGRYKDINKRGGEVAVINITSQVKRIFEVSGMLKILNIYSSEDEAVDNILGR